MAATHEANSTALGTGEIAEPGRPASPPGKKETEILTAGDPFHHDDLEAVLCPQDVRPASVHPPSSLWPTTDNTAFL